MIQIFVNANYDFVGKRRWFYLGSAALIAISLLSILIRGGLNYGIDFTGGTLIQVRYDKPVSVGDVRRGLDEIKLGSAIIQQFGDAAGIPDPAAQGGETPEQVTPKVQAALAKAVRGQVRNPAGGVRRPAGRPRPPAAGALRGARRDGGHPDLRRDPLRPEGRRHLDHRHRPRRADHPRRPVDLQPRDLAVGPGGAAHRHRLLGQRHDRHLRPDSGKPRPRSPKRPDPCESRQHRDQPDAVSHHPDRSRRSWPRRPVPVRGGGAGGLRVHADRRRGRRHLFDRVHRRGADRGLGDVEPEPPELAAQGARQG